MTRVALAAALAYFAFALVATPRRFNGSCFTYAVAAETGFAKRQALAHPFWVPALRAAAAVAPGPRPHFRLFRAVSAAFGAAGVGLLCAAALAWGAPPAAAALAALWAGLSPSYLFYAVQPGPYAAAFACLALLLFATAGGRHGLAGAAAGAAAGFSPAGLAAAAALRSRRSLAAFGLALGAAAAAAWLQSRGSGAALSWRFARSFAPGASVFDGRGALEQAGLLARALLRDWPLWPALLALPFAHAGRARVASLCAALAAFFLVFDPGNALAFACLAPLCLLAARPRAVPALAAAALLCAGLGWRTLHAEPDDGSDSWRVEGDFLMERSKPGDLLLAVAPPDWRLLYFYPRLTAAYLTFGPDEENPFAVTAVAPGPQADALVKGALRRGADVRLAADAFFREVKLDDAAWAARQAAVQSWALKSFRLAQAEVSPEGQHYYRLVEK